MGFPKHGIFTIIIKVQYTLFANFENSQRKIYAHRRNKKPKIINRARKAA